MPIEINGPASPQADRTGNGGPLRVVHDASGPKPHGGAAGSADSVSLTGDAALMQHLDERISAAPVVDTARVNSIRQSIADGSFGADPARVAGKLIDHEIALHAGH